MQVTRMETPEGVEFVTVFVDGQMKSAHNAHPNWDLINEMIEHDDPNVINYMDVPFFLEKKFSELSDRISVSRGIIHFDGSPIDNKLTKHILRMLREDQDYMPFVYFMENLMQNPNEHSREQLYNYLDQHEFTITWDGLFVGYKGVQVTEEDGEKRYQSNHKGRAIVDGEEHVGHIPNNPGSVVMMPRESVDDNTYAHCSTGLHVGTHQYATSFARDVNGVLLEVHVNPRDVQSVPNDGHEKIRCWRYEVVKVIEDEYKQTVLPSESIRDLNDLDDHDDEDPYGFESL